MDFVLPRDFFDTSTPGVESMSRVPVLTLENAPEAARPFLQTALNNSG